MEFSWHESIWHKLENARAQDQLSHALLLIGENGVGRLDLAQSIVKSLLCLNPNNYRSCNNCKACNTYESGANPDYLSIELLEGKQQIGVDQVRKISTFLNFTSSFNSYRVVLINPIERMNKNAANSLLKSLEEPNDDSVILLLANSISAVLPTIKSRSQILHVKTPSKSESLKWMGTNFQDLNNQEMVLKIANGKPLKAIDIKGSEIQDREELLSNINAITQDKNSITKVAKHWEKYEIQLLLDWQIQWVQTCIKKQQMDEENLKIINACFSQDKLWELYQALIGYKKLVHTSVNSLVLIENMLMLWSNKNR